MHEKSPLLKASKRERLGSRYAQRDRSAGKLPAIVYGHGLEPVPILLDAHDTLRHIRQGEKIFRLDLSGAQAGDSDQMVLLKDLQFDHLGSNVVHCDLARVDLNERVHTKVHIRLIGEPIGLKQAGTLLMHPTTEIEIECRVVDLPDFIEVNMSNLDLGQTITAADVKLPMGDMKLVTDGHSVIVQVVMGVELKVAEETPVAVEGEAQPEVITAKKPAEGEAAAPAAPGAKGAAPAKGAPAAAGKGAAPGAPAKGAAGAPGKGAPPAAAAGKGAPPPKGGGKK